MGVFRLFCIASCNRFEKGAAIHTRKRRAMQNGFNMLAFSRCQASPRILSHTWHSLAIPGYGLFALDRLGNSKKILPCIRWCSVGNLWMAWPCRGNAHPLLYGVRFVRFLGLVPGYCFFTVIYRKFHGFVTALHPFLYVLLLLLFRLFIACSMVGAASFFYGRQIRKILP